MDPNLGDERLRLKKRYAEPAINTAAPTAPTAIPAFVPRPRPLSPDVDMDVADVAAIPAVDVTCGVVTVLAKPVPEADEDVGAEEFVEGKEADENEEVVEDEKVVEDEEVVEDKEVVEDEEIFEDEEVFEVKKAARTKNPVLETSFALWLYTGLRSMNRRTYFAFWIKIFCGIFMVQV
ncbi:hypothetical protein NHQ30_011198 [Ciborinia camelliae]|nr:hypothetical protein NHQ30_011198 [Ciborinia camelliae]